MKRKTSAAPTKIWTFGALPPASNAERIDEQMRLGRVYRNKLIEIELRRRAAIRAAQLQVGDIAALQETAEAIAKDLESVRLEIKAARKEARLRVETTEADARARALRDALKATRDTLKAAKARLKEDPSVLAAYKVADAAAAQEIRDARAACGVYWGTYLVVEAAHQQVRASRTDPRFRRWDGSGRVAVQISPGLTAENIETNTKFRLPAGRHVVARLRIGTDEDGRSPIWADIPVVIHRPLPADAVVKWAWLRRTKLATAWRWELQVVIESMTFAPPIVRRPGVVALDVGWRVRPGGDLRVAYWADDTGQHGEYLLPHALLDKLDHADSLRAIQDRNRNAFLPALVEWMQSRNDLPEWMVDARKALSQWRSSERIAGLIWRWRSERIAGDDEMFARADAWRRQWRHLYQWEVNERDKATARRKDIYRNVAAELARRYGTIVVEKFDLRSVAELPAAEDGAAEPQAVRRHRKIASVSELRGCLPKHAVVTVDGAWTTQTCSGCGEITKFDAAEHLMFACGQCGQVIDQDHNAAMNMLRAFERLGGEASGGNDSEELAGQGGDDLGGRSKTEVDQGEIAGVF